MRFLFRIFLQTVVEIITMTCYKSYEEETIIATTNKGFRKTAKPEPAHIFTYRSAHSIQAAFFDIIVAEYQRRNGG